MKSVITRDTTDRESITLIPAKGALRRAPVLERVSRDASLGVEVIPRDRGAHDHLLEENRRDITGSESARESVSVNT